MVGHNSLSLLILSLNEKTTERRKSHFTLNDRGTPRDQVSSHVRTVSTSNLGVNRRGNDRYILFSTTHPYDGTIIKRSLEQFNLPILVYSISDFRTLGELTGLGGQESDVYTRSFPI